MNAETEALSPFALLLSYVAQFHEKRELRAQEGASAKEYLAFSAGDEAYLISMGQVLEVATSLGELAPLPFSPVWLLGLVGHRNEIYSVVDFSLFLNKKYKPSSKAARAFILLRDAGQGYILKVDNVYGIRTCDMTQLDAPSGWIDGHAHMEDREWRHINVAGLTADPAFVQNFN